MFALVESGKITKYLNGNKGVTIGDKQYPKAIFGLWSKDEREAIGIYEIEIDNTNKKDEKWYINTDITYSFGSGKVTGSYGTATAKAHADSLFTAQDETDGLGAEGDVKSEGLKTILIRNLKSQAANELKNTDWYIIRKADKGTAIPSNIQTWRDAIRTKATEMETAISDCSSVDDIAKLWLKVDEDGKKSGILYDWPSLGS